MTELTRISQDVHEQGGEPEARLRAKCNHEQRTRTAVIAEWGDPRNWETASGDRKCEGCDKPATVSDPEGVPLCAECAKTCNED